VGFMTLSGGGDLGCRLPGRQRGSMENRDAAMLFRNSGGRGELLG
jgi:hypothetical protein